MRLQLALDAADIAGALSLLDLVHDLVDIVEVGTPLMISEGVRAVRRVREEHSGLAILADLKIMDAGRYEADLGFEAGADIVTVLGVAQDETVRGAVQSARGNHGRVMADLISVPNPADRAGELIRLGVDYVCVHTPHDLAGSAGTGIESLVELLHRLAGAVPPEAIAVAGGIDARAIEALAPLGMEIAVVGGAISAAADPRGVAEACARALGRRE